MNSESTPLTSFGELVKDQRTVRQWSQDELANRAGVSRPTIARIEAGRAVSTATLFKVAEALRIEVNVKTGG